METQIISGYVGVFRQPYADNHLYGDTVYLVTDSLHQELNVIMLTPGCYKEVYKVASRVSYQVINIFVPAMDDFFRSDVIRLIRDHLCRIKPSVKFHFPEKIKTYPKNYIIETCCKKTEVFRSKNIDGVVIYYAKSHKEHDLYDIVVNDRNKTMLFSLFMSAEHYRGDLRFTQDRYDAIHLPYMTTFYGGLTAKECYHLNCSYGKKLVANNFTCREEYIEAKEKREINVGYQLPTMQY